MTAAIYRPFSAVLFGLFLCGSLSAAPLVPGTGQKMTQVGDDFEPEEWGFIQNLPKSSEEQDKQQRLPTGRSTNGRWYEGIKRGHPDFMTRVPTPEGGLPGSEGSLLFRTRLSGIPGSRSYSMQQDDLVANIQYRMRGTISVSQSPSCDVRVYLPPFEKWEDRSGSTFGYRIAVQTHAWKTPDSPRGFFFRNTPQYTDEVYWPGIFIQFRSKTDSRHEEDSAYFTIRGNRRGADFKGPEITETGWWTLGMSCTPDGQVHYYIRQGVDDLTEADHVTSQYPYSYKAEQFRTFFFNVCNRDDGSTWSTPWIIDDPSLYIGSRQVARKSSSSR
jgi:hypothetical protein